jgi:hypothetical protein
MKICSWDVGIYNLSYCILEQDDISKEIKILKWDIVKKYGDDMVSVMNQLCNMTKKMGLNFKLLDDKILCAEF